MSDHTIHTPGRKPYVKGPTRWASRLADVRANIPRVEAKIAADPLSVRAVGWKVRLAELRKSEQDYLSALAGANALAETRVSGLKRLKVKLERNIAGDPKSVRVGEWKARLETLDAEITEAERELALTLTGKTDQKEN